MVDPADQSIEWALMDLSSRHFLPHKKDKRSINRTFSEVSNLSQLNNRTFIDNFQKFDPNHGILMRETIGMIQNLTPKIA